MSWLYLVLTSNLSCIGVTRYDLAECCRRCRRVGARSSTPRAPAYLDALAQASFWLYGLNQPYRPIKTATSTSAPIMLPSSLLDSDDSDAFWANAGCIGVAVVTARVPAIATATILVRDVKDPFAENRTMVCGVVCAK